MIELLIDFYQKLSNREIAVFIWIALFFIWGLAQHKIRDSFSSVVKAFFAWKLTLSYLAMFLYIALILILLYSLGIWKFSYITNTILWIVGVAFVMLFEHSKANNESFFKNVIKDNLKILVALEFIINLYVFSLWVELILVPTFGILGGMLAITEFNKQYEVVQKGINYIMTIIGTFFIGYAVYMTASDFNNFLTLGNFKNFILPILLTIMFSPFIYFWALYASYETLFIRLQFFVNDKSLLSYVKKKTIFTFRLNLWVLNKWTKHINTLRFEDENSVDEAIRKFKNMIMYQPAGSDTKIDT